jgi:hypothetical protein
MTLRWIEGFETNRTQNELTRKYASYSGGDPYLVDGDRSDRACWLFDMTTPEFTDDDTWVIGMSFQLLSVPQATDTEIIMLLGGSEQCKLTFTAAGSTWEMQIKRGSTELEETTLSYDIGTWYYLEFQVTPHATTGSYQVRLNSDIVLEGTGVNTADTGNPQGDAFQLKSGAVMDNIYILDSQGDKNNTFLGEQVVEGSFPVGDGAYLEWTPATGTTHYNLVDDDPLSILSNDEVSTTGSGNKDTYDMEALNRVEGAISGVIFMPIVSLDTAGTESLKVLVVAEDGTVNELDADTFGWGAGTIRTVSRVEEDSPDTGEAWEADEISEGEAGVELQ